MKSYIVRMGLIFVLALAMLSCAKEKVENFNIERIYLRLMKSASMDEAGSFAKDGYAVYGLMLSDEKHQLNKDPEILDSLIIKGPDGQEFQKIKTGVPFAIGSRTGGSGYQIYGLKDQGVIWAGVDLLLDTKTPPSNGKYVFEATLKSGKKLTGFLAFEAYQIDPIQGFVTQIQFDEKSRTLKWKGTQGQTGYRIAIYQGVKQGRPDTSKMLFNAETKETSFMIPDSVEFQGGQSYYMIVDAFYSKPGGFYQANYVHHQDNDSEIAIYKPAASSAKADKIKTALALSDVPYSYPVKYTVVNGSKVAYIDEGKGIPIVMIHGLSTDLNSFRVLYPALIEKGYRVVALDLIGYGKSGKPDIKHTIAFHAKTALDFIKKLNLSKIVLLGHSMGGAISLSLAEKNPEFLKLLILLTPGGTYQFPEDTAIYYKSVYDSQFSKRFSDAAIAKAYYAESVYKWNSLMDDFMDIRERSMLHSDWKNTQKTIKNSSISFTENNNEIAGKIGMVKIPVLALFGENDNTIKTAPAVNYIKQNAKNWKVQVFPECGHMIQYEQKDKTIQAILDFLAKNQ